MQSKGLAVVAVGGNALIKDKNHQTVHDQYQAAAETMKHIASMIIDGWDVVVTHGNGPQVGFILRRSEIAAHELHEVPLDYCGADTQGAIGYMFQQALHNEFHLRGIDKQAATVITQTIVDRKDPAFENPTKPIGSFMEEAAAKEKIVITGTQSDEAILEPIRQALAGNSGIIWLDRKLSGPMLLHVLHGARVVLAPSTGVAHLAASLGRKVIGLYSPVKVQHPTRWAPQGEKVEVLVPDVECPGKKACLGPQCQHYDCMNRISLESVRSAWS